MQKLAKREEQIMQALWDLEQAFIKEVMEALPSPQPHYNSVATMVKVLEEKGFVGRRSLGNAHQYYPLISREQYRKGEVGRLLQGYFDNSYKNLVAYFAEEENLNEAEVQELIALIKKGKQS